MIKQKVFFFKRKSSFFTRKSYNIKGKYYDIRQVNFIFGKENKSLKNKSLTAFHILRPLLQICKV